MKNVDATEIEFYGWFVAIVTIFVIPVILFVILKVIAKDMPYKRTTAFYLGWIPGNLVSCWYLHYAIGWFDGIMILFFCQAIQLVFVLMMAQVIGKVLGKDYFD
jgi:hypothetical protein